MHVYKIFVYFYEGRYATRTKRGGALQFESIDEDPISTSDIVVAVEGYADIHGSIKY